MKDDFSTKKIEEVLGCHFSRPELLVEAFTHPSYANEQVGRRLPHNQRLEFLGDAVIGLAVGLELWRRYPTYPEGELARLRALVVNERALAAQAASMGLGQLLRVGRGEEKSGGRTRPSNLCDLFEAVCGAVFIDQGWETACSFVLRMLGDQISAVAQARADIDVKTELQEKWQHRYGERPEYHLTQVEGPAHCRQFRVEVRGQGKVLGDGVGFSKKEAEKAAAAAALKAIAADQWPDQ